MFLYVIGTGMIARTTHFITKISISFTVTIICTAAEQLLESVLFFFSTLSLYVRCTDKCNMLFFFSILLLLLLLLFVYQNQLLFCVGVCYFFYFTFVIFSMRFLCLFFFSVLFCFVSNTVSFFMFLKHTNKFMNA